MIWLIAYAVTVILSFIVYIIYRIKGFIFREPGDDTMPFVFIAFVPLINNLGIFSLLYEMKKEKPQINYELKYKTLTKMIIKQNILTKEQIEDLENTATIMNKLLL